MRNGKILTMAVAALALTAVRAEYLYWQVTGQSDYANGYAGLRANGSLVDGYYQLDSSGSMGGAASYDLSLIGGGTTYTYYIELLNSSFSSSSTSEEKTYAQLSDSTGTGELSDMPRIKIWHGSKYSGVPEPTGGLLVLLGAGLLALRRGKTQKGSAA